MSNAFLRCLPTITDFTGAIQVTKENLLELALKTKYFVCTGTVTTPDLTPVGGNGNGSNGSNLTFSFPCVVGGCKLGSVGFGALPQDTIPTSYPISGQYGWSYYTVYINGQPTGVYWTEDTSYSDPGPPSKLTCNQIGNLWSTYFGFPANDIGYNQPDTTCLVFAGAIVWTSFNNDPTVQDGKMIVPFNSTTNSNKYYSADELNALVSPLDAHVDYGLYASIGFAKDSSGNYYVTVNLAADSGYGGTEEYAGYPAGPSTQSFDGVYAYSGGSNPAPQGGTLFLKAVDGTTLGSCPLFGNVGDVTLTAGPKWSCSCPPGYSIYKHRPQCGACHKIKKIKKRCKSTNTIIKCFRCNPVNKQSFTRDPLPFLKVGEQWDGVTYNVDFSDVFFGLGSSIAYSNNTGELVYGAGTGAIQVDASKVAEIVTQTRIIVCSGSASQTNRYGDTTSMSFSFPAIIGFSGAFAAYPSPESFPPNQSIITDQYSNFNLRNCSILPVNGSIVFSNMYDLSPFSGDTQHYTASELNSYCSSTGIGGDCNLSKILFFKDSSNNAYMLPIIYTTADSAPIGFSTFSYDSSLVQIGTATYFGDITGPIYGDSSETASLTLTMVS
jgi:hypothetical protein